MTEPKRNSDINSLSPKFRKKFDSRWVEVRKKYPDATVFETLRSNERQQRLRDESNRREKLWQPRITRTLKSRHLEGNAVDVVFYDDRRTQVYDNKPTRYWPYDDLIEIAKKYGIKNLKPKETCHFEDDGTEYNPISEKEMSQVNKTLKENSNLWEATTNQIVRDQLKETNSKIREIYSLK